jgi:copper chaperone
MAETTLMIEGMSCQHCVMSVQKALAALEGVKSYDVSLGTAKVTYDDTSITRAALEEAVRNAGYRITG